MNYDGKKSVIKRFFQAGLAFSVLLCPPLKASDVVNVHINYVISNKEGYVFFGTGPKAAAPGCDSMQRWAVRGDSIAGQVLVSSILSAYMSGKMIDVFGAGSCAVWGDSETVNYIVMH